MSITATEVRAWIARFAADVAEHRAELVKLDTAIGDGDHGTNMDRGMRKAVEKLDALEGDDVGAILKAVGMALVSSVGGAAGPLYGTLFLQMGASAAGKDGARPGGLDRRAGDRREGRAGARQGRARGQDDDGRAAARGGGAAVRRRRRRGPRRRAARSRPRRPRRG